MAVEYKSDSPYANTEMYSYYPDVLTPRVIRPLQMMFYTHSTQVHEYRPDLLAFDLYGNSNLWCEDPWLEIPNAFEDAIWDFRVGTKFYSQRKKLLILL